MESESAYRLPAGPPGLYADVEVPAAGARRPRDWSPMERMQLVLDAHDLADYALGELLHRRGVHREQLDAWRADAAGFGQSSPSRRSPEGKRIKQLERELARKDKALAGERRGRRHRQREHQVIHGTGTG